MLVSINATAGLRETDSTQSILHVLSELRKLRAELHKLRAALHKLRSELHNLPGEEGRSQMKHSRKLLNCPGIVRIELHFDIRVEADVKLQHVSKVDDTGEVRDVTLLGVHHIAPVPVLPLKIAPPHTDYSKWSWNIPIAEQGPVDGEVVLKVTHCEGR